MTTNKATIIENIPFTIDPVRAMREMKIPRITSLDEIEEKPVAESIKKAIDKGYSLIKGKGIYKRYKLTGVDGDVVRGDGISDLFSGKNIVKLLEECDYATLIACTIGDKLENEVERLQGAGEMTDAYSLEMVGGWMADYMAERVDERVEREIKKLGYGRTMRYSPGYGDWGLTSQPELLSLVEAKRVGIRLTESNIMIPRKSVSAVIGWKRL